MCASYFLFLFATHRPRLTRYTDAHHAAGVLRQLAALSAKSLIYGGRDWDRTSDPCDVKAGAAAQPSDFYEHGRDAGRRLRHHCTPYVLVKWFNEPKSTLLQSFCSVLDAGPMRRAHATVGANEKSVRES